MRVRYSALAYGKEVVMTLGSRAVQRMVICGLLLSLASCGLKSETALRRQFAEHKATILQILRMQLQDTNVVRIAPGFTRLKNDWSWPRKDIGFSEARWNVYRALFREALITEGIQYDDSDVFFFVSSEGLAVAGTSRGFVYKNDRPADVAKDFDSCQAGVRICYVLITPHWYLFQWVV